jgi:hypothetical protein
VDVGTVELSTRLFGLTVTIAALFQGTWPGQVTHTPIDHNSAPQNGADSHLELLPLQSPLLRLLVIILLS